MKNNINLLLLIFILLQSTSLAQNKFRISNASKNYDIEIYCDSCFDKGCFDKAKFYLFRKNEISAFQIIESGNCYLSLNDSTGLPDSSTDIIYFGDYNFDGQKDISVMNGHHSCYGLPSYDVYLYSAKLKGFVKDNVLTELAGSYCGMFGVDTARKVLKTYSKSGCCLDENKEFKFTDNKLIEIFSETHEYLSDGREKITTVKLVNEEWKNCAICKRR